MSISIKELISEYDLPVEVISSLKKPRQVVTEQGWFTLGSSESFSLITINIYQGKASGTYWMPAISLITGSENYGEAKGILVWLPRLKCFGTYDSSHEDLFIFSEKSWDIIDADLTNFLELQWKKNKSIKYEKPKKYIQNFDYLPSEYDIRTLYDQIKKNEKISIEDENFLRKSKEQLLKFPIKIYEKGNLKKIQNTYSEICEGFSIASRNLGKICYKEGKYDLAANWYLESEELLKQFSKDTLKSWRWNFYDNYMADYFYLGMSLYYSKKHEQSIKYLKYYEGFKPTSDIPLFFIGRALAILGDNDNSILYYKKAVDLNTTNPDVYNNLSIMIANKYQDYSQAISLIEKSIELDKNNDQKGGFDFNKSCFYAISNQDTLAINSLKTALEKGYDNLNSILADADLKGIIYLDATQQLLKQYFPTYKN